MRRTYIKVAGVILAVLAVASFALVYIRRANADSSTPSASLYDVSTDAGRWVEDSEVTAVGKAGARAREVLNWALAVKDAGFSSGGNNTLKTTWARIRDMMGIFYFIILIVVGFGLIAKQDWAEKTRRSLPALIIAFIAAYFSFFAAAGIIKFTDEQLQQRFYTIHNWDKSGTLDEKHLRAQDLLTVSFSYQDFRGFRKVGPSYGEAISNHLLLVKITTFTNYVIAFIILLRIVILWGLVIFSPFMFPFFVFPLTKKVATVWLREFFRWLLLGPLFALFLTAVPYMWSKTNISVQNIYPGQKATNSSIPLEINKTILSPAGGSGKTSGNVYESGTNIILSPPGNSNPDIQKDNVISSGNNLSETDTYARWIVALLMIWGAIILPFMLLRIIMGFSVEVSKGISNIFGGSQAAQYISNWKKVITPPPPTPLPTGTRPGERIYREKTIERSPIIAPTKQIISQSEKVSTFSEKSIEKLSVPSILNVAGLKQEVPDLFNLASAAENQGQRKVSELARIEQQGQKAEVISQAINKIAEPEKIADASDQQRFEKVKQSILMRSVAGDKSAQAMKNAISNNVSQYLVTDVNNEVRDTMAKSFDNSISSITNNTINQSEVQQFQTVYQTQGAENFGKILSQLAQNQDQRGALATSALEKIKQVENLPADQKAVAKQRVSLNLSNPQLISDPNESREFSALKEVIEQGANSGIVSLQGVLSSSANYANMSLGGTKITQNHATSLAGALSALSSSGSIVKASSDPKNQARIGNLKELEQTIKSALASGSSEGVKQAIETASKLNSPEQIQDPAEKQKYQNVSGLIEESAKAGVVEAKNIEDVLDNISADLDVDQNSNITISSVADLRNILQKDEDYIRTKNLWVNNFTNAPTEAGKDRTMWLKEEETALQKNLDDFISNDPSRKEAALKNIQKILPLALMGNYKASEVAKYLLAKLDATKEVIKNLSSPKQDQGELELVNIRNQSQNNQNTQQIVAEEESA